MASTNKRISVSELDFDAIKNNLKEFLKGQDQFSDYDFEGSGLAILLDVLAYNTHYNGIYTNLAVNELFLDSASKRASVVSLSKMLGYTPRSAKCAKAIVNATIVAPTSSPEVVSIPANQEFTTSIDNITYTFYNRSAVTVPRSSSGNYTFSNLELTEGTPLSFKYTVAQGIRYIIPNPNVDIDTVTVKVQESADSNNFENFVRSSSLLDALEDTRIYFIKEIDDGLYEVDFGDGVVGRKLENGNVVTIQYFVSNLDKPNGASNFTYGGISIAGGNLAITTVDKASGGDAFEDVESIKYNAPRMYAAQNRAVTPDDYKSIVLSQFPVAESVSVWGGEDNDPPIYGKVFICVKPKSASVLTQLQKDFLISSILRQRNMVSVTPEIVDPEILKVKVNCFVYYNPTDTEKTPAHIESLVKDAIIAYSDTDLEKFDKIFRFSKMSRIIDEADPSIVSNISSITIHKEITPFFNISTEYTVNLINPISQDGSNQGEVFSTSGFFIPNSTFVHYLDDDSRGNIRLYFINNNFEKVIVNPTIGEINYSLGTIVVRNLNIVSLSDPIFKMIFKPESYDVVSALNQVVEVSKDLLQVKAIADATANGDLRAGFNYQFNSIR
jgi:hypothetical protein